jgi:hypothetical protein
MSDDADIIATADGSIMRAIVTWSPNDKRILAALIELGPPSALHAGFPDVPGEHERDPRHGNVPAMRRDGGVGDRVRADALHVYRELGTVSGAKLPPPGR